MSGRRLKPAFVIGAIVLAAFTAMVIYAVPLDRFLVMPDELVYSKAAQQIWGSPALVRPGSDWFVSWSQLLPLVYSIPLGAANNLVDGVRVAHVIAAAAMALTAVPAYLLALEVSGQRSAGYLVSALCVAVPWIAMSGTLMTEVFAYPAFTWAAWATVRACKRPSPGADAHALIASLVAVFARTQLVFAPVAVVLAVGVCALRLRRPLRRHWVLAIPIGAALLALAVQAVASGSLNDTLGTYGSLQQAHSASAAIAGKLTAYVGIALAAVPLILGIPWLVGALFRREPAEQLGFSVFATTSILIVVFQASLELTQPGRLHDRYLVYAIPLLFTAMAVALLSPQRRVAGTIVTGLLFALLVSRYDFFEAGAELPSLSFTLHEPIGKLAFNFGDAFGIADLSPGWFLAGVVVALTGVLVLVGRAYANRALLIVGLPLLIFCMAQTADAFHQIRNSFYGFGFIEPRPRNWVDENAPPGAKVGLILGQVGNPLATPVAWWDVGYWNKKVDRWYTAPGDPNRWGQASTHVLAVDRSGRPLDKRSWWVVTTGDPRVHVAGGVVVARAGDLELRRSGPGTPLRLIR